MIGKVTEWQMTPEQLEEYRKKYPIKKKKSDKNKDFKWRGKKGAESRWNVE